MVQLRISDIREISYIGSGTFGWQPCVWFTHILVESCLVSVYVACTSRVVHWAFQLPRWDCLCTMLPCAARDGWGVLVVNLGNESTCSCHADRSLVPVHEGSPLGELHRCIREGVKVNVHVRTFKGLRGVCTGFLVAFDKFWNMVIKPFSRGWRTS